MKILLRDNYKIQPDELYCMGLSEKYAKEFVKELNSRPRNDHKYFQVVSDDFKKYLDDENKRVKYRSIGKRIVGDQIYYYH